MSKILVTGYKGWIGRNFTKILDDNQIEWVGIDRVDGEDLLHSFRYFYEKVQDCDIVVHLAATARIPPSWERYDYYRNNNITVTDKVARACTDLGKHLIYASSSSVTGNGDGPLNPYSWSKLAGEQSIEMYGRSCGLNYTILRFFTNYGEDDASGLVIGKWLALARAGEPITLRGSGQQSRDFIHVRDTASAILACVQQLPKNVTLDIGTGTGYTLSFLAQLFDSKVITEAELDGYAVATKADLERTQQHLTWWPRVELVGWIKTQLSK
jgi:UDP-glucose 4-epimerase